jgi:sulfate transport system ATP-binding protein
VRPFDLEVTPAAQSPSGAVIAVVRYIASAGPVVRLELRRQDNDATLEAEIPRERYRELGIAVGDLVGVTPRNLRSFGEAGDGVVREAERHS